MRDADAAGFGQRFEAGGDIDAIAENVALVGDDVAEIDADAEADAPVLCDLRLAVEHHPLDFDRAAHRVDDAGEFDQHAVAGGLDDAPSVLADFRIDQLAPVRLEAGERALLVGAHQPGIAGDVGGEDGGEPARAGEMFGERHFSQG